MLALTDVAFAWAGARSFGLAIPHFAVARGETVMLLGDSGSGKSTLLSLICGTLVAQGGRIEVGRTDIASLSAAQRDRLRAESIGVIFQQFSLLPHATVADNIALPLRFAPGPRNRAGAIRGETERLLAAMGLDVGLMARRAASLSIGQQQRVAVARALIGAPGLILADEPISALDARTQARFLELQFGQLRAAGGTLVMVSHDERLADRFDRAVRIEDIAAERATAA